MTPRMTLSLALLALLAGCADTDPFLRDGNWRPNGANERNLLAMVSEKGDLRRGRAAAGADGQRAALAVERLRADRVKALPATGIARVTVTGPPGGAGAGGAGAAASGF